MTVKMPDGRGVRLVLLVLCGLCCWFESAESAKCPWDQPGLLKWSDPSAWDGNTVPKANGKVKIPKGKRVVLDIQPEILATLTIESGGALIWGDVDGLQLSTHYILIEGEFHIGSEECKFDKKAHIRLLGSYDSKHSHDVFGRKFIGVSENATIELHGKNKTSWSKLAQTVKRPDELECGFVYDIEKTVLGKENRNGVRVIVWATNGTVVDYNIIADKKEFQPFFDAIPSGLIIGIHVSSKTHAKGLDKETLTSLGGTLLKNAGPVEFYAFVGKKGEPESNKEFLIEVKGGNTIAGLTDKERYLSYHNKKDGLVYGVSLDTKKRFRILHEDVAYPKLTLASEVHGWEKGDRVVVTSTDINWKQAEIREIVECHDCSKRQVRVNDTFRYLHYGNFTMNVDERAEVAMLTRNILIEGIMGDKCNAAKDLCKKMGNVDVFGGHLRINRYHKSARIEGVELVHMGQQRHLGSYPLHFHMCDTVNGSYLRQNTVYESFSRCFTIHGTNNLQVVNNVCFIHRGHGLFLEDSVEQNNTIKGNLVAGTMYGTLLMSDMESSWCKADQKDNCGDVSSYWLTHPNNLVEDNVAAGGQAHGFTYMFANNPLGPSLQRQKELGIKHDPRVYPMKFTRNTAHSYDTSGIFIDCRISNGKIGGLKGDPKQENAVIRGAFEYYPMIDGKPVFANISHIHSFKSRRFAFWVKGGNIRVTYSTMADSSEAFSGGTSKMDSGARIYKSIIVGETENKGYVSNPVLDHKDAKGNILGPYTSSLTGVTIYQGPVLVESCYFDKYEIQDFCRNKSLTVEQCSSHDIVTRYAGAITFKKHSHYPFMSSSYVENTTYGYCNEKKTPWVFQGDDGQGDFKWTDGNRMVYVQDKDGMLTGSKDAVVVNDMPVYTGPDCESRPEWGKLAVCPYRYVKMKILGEEGSLSNDLRKHYALNIWRTDTKYDQWFTMNGDIRNEFLLRTGSSFLLDLNLTATNPSKKSAKPGFSREYTFFGFGVEIPDRVRIGICQPKDVTSYKVVMRYPTRIQNNATWVDNFADLDNDETGQALFHDKKRGILFFKIMSFHNDDNATQQCPQGKCFKIHIEVEGGSLNTLRSCREELENAPDLKIPDFNDKRKVAQISKPLKPAPKCKKGSPEGLGPDNIRNPGFLVHEEFEPECRSIPNPRKVDVVGCFRAKKGYHNITYETVNNPKSMTPAFCVTRCYYRKYKFAGLFSGRTCTCGNELPKEKNEVESPCNVACPGDSTQECGGKQSIQVWKTGYVKEN